MWSWKINCYPNFLQSVCNFFCFEWKVYSERGCKALGLPEVLWKRQHGWWFVWSWKVEFASFQLWDLGLNHFSATYREKVSGSQAHCWSSPQGWRWSVKTKAVPLLLGTEVSRWEPARWDQSPQVGICLAASPRLVASWARWVSLCLQGEKQEAEKSFP